jgi:hypothetical protein
MGVVSLLTAYPRAIADDTIKDFVFTGATPQTSFQLKDDEYETVMENQEVPDTCTRQVLDGYDNQCTPTTRRECHDEQQQQCTPTTRRECTPTTRRECTSTTRQQCSTTTRQQCTSTTRRQCTSTTRRECSTTTHNVCTGGGSQCHDQPDQVCHAGPTGQQVCQTVTRRVCEQTPPDCHPETQNQCQDVPDQVCQDVPDQVCQDVPEQTCQDVPDQTCQDVPDQVCQDVPDQVCQTVSTPVCQDVSDQVCQQVPRYRDETYACTTTQQVPVQELSSETLGNVTVAFGPVPQGIRPNETFTATLADQDVTLKVKKASGLLVILAQKSQDSQETDSVTTVLTSRFAVSLVLPADVAAAIKAGIADETLDERSFSLTLGKLAFKDVLAVDLTLASADTGQSYFNGRVPIAKATLQNVPQTARTKLTLQLSDLGIASNLPAGRYSISLRVGAVTTPAGAVLDASALRGIQPVSDQKTIVVN